MGYSSSGDIEHKNGYGRDNFRGPGNKRNSGTSASGQPWSGGRPNDEGHSRRSSVVSGPARPSSSRPKGGIVPGKQSGN